MCSRSNSSDLAGAVGCSTSGKSSALTPSRLEFHTALCRMGRLRKPKSNLRLGLSANCGVRVAVEPGLEPANRFDLSGQSVVAEKPALLRESDPELSDVAQTFTMDRINRDPKRPLAVGRLLPWIYLRHGGLLRRGTCRRETHLSPYRNFSTLSSLRTGFSP
jgi:hypothetical protein